MGPYISLRACTKANKVPLLQDVELRPGSMVQALQNGGPSAKQITSRYNCCAKQTSDAASQADFWRNGIELAPIALQFS